ncbi:MAG: hypothetical protein C4524_00820 [Candidatus Zixiibacteriota bacterium]|nr:MAG: hypothetical protein C4524_00820 [candidate division Zixibacteria bacterium]
MSIDWRLWLLGCLIIGGCAGSYSGVEQSLKRENYQSAKRQLQASGPRDAQGWVLLAETHYRLGDYPAFLQAADTALTYTVEIRPRVQYLLNLAWTETLNRANAELEDGHYAAAAELYDHLFPIAGKIDARYHPEVRARESDVRLLAGTAHLHAGHPAPAREYLEAVARDRRNDPRVLQQLALAYYYLGDEQACLDACRRLLMYEQESPEGLKLKALMEGDPDQRQEALREYLEAHAADSQAILLHRNLGIILFQLADWRQAREHLEIAYQADPANSSDLLIPIAECYYNEARYAEALDQLQQAARQHPDDPDILRYQGACLWNLERRAEAEAAFAAARQLAAAMSLERTAPPDSLTRPEAGAGEEGR